MAWLRGSAGSTVYMDLQDIAFIGSGSGGATTVSWTQIVSSGASASGMLTVSEARRRHIDGNPRGVTRARGAPKTHELAASVIVRMRLRPYFTSS